MSSELEVFCLGYFLAETSSTIEPLCQGAHEGSIDIGYGLKCLLRRDHSLVSPDRLIKGDNSLNCTTLKVLILIICMIRNIHVGS